MRTFGKLTAVFGFLFHFLISAEFIDAQAQNSTATNTPLPVFTVTARCGPKGFLTDSEIQTTKGIPPILDQAEVLFKDTQQLPFSSSHSFPITNGYTLQLQMLEQSNESVRISFALQHTQDTEKPICLSRGNALFKVKEYLLLNGFSFQDCELVIVIVRNELNPDDNGKYQGSPDSSQNDTQQKQSKEKQEQDQQQAKEQESKKEQAKEAQPEKPSEEMTPEEAAMMLDAMKAQEQSQRDQLHPFFGRPVPVEKDW